MKLTLPTQKFQEMVNKAVKGASNNKMIPITGLMAIELKDGVLTLTTTDATNTLTIIAKDITGEDFYAVVQTDLFSKLVAKTSTEKITLTLKETNLEVKGNGTYNIELPLDEEGQPIRFRGYNFDTTGEKVTMNLSTVKALLTSNKAAIAETMEVPCLTGYYCYPDGVLTTDTFKVCGTAIKVFDRPVLLPAELMNLLALIDQEKIEVHSNGGKLLFVTDNVVIHGVELEGAEDYPVDAIVAFLDTEFTSVCQLSKNALLSVLDRLSLFVTQYDKNGVYLTFTKEGVIISSKKSNGTELLKYTESKNFKPFTCCADIELLKSQINAQDGDTVELWYGHEKATKMTFGKITQILALLEDDRNTEDAAETES